MEIYFLRHGQSTFNENPSNDSLDCPLTSNGIEQSNQMNFSSFPKHYSLIICSPLHRCIETLKHSKITSNQFEINDLFREIRSGCQSDLLKENEDILLEDEPQIKQRIHQINQYLLEKKKQSNLRNILIVTHGDLVWNLTKHQFNGEDFGTWLNNAELFYWKQI